MATKTIAVDLEVYEKLAAAKQEGESFSRTIDRLLAEFGDAHTGREIVARLEAISPLTDDEAQVFLRVIAENRSDEDWAPVALR